MCPRSFYSNCFSSCYRLGFPTCFCRLLTVSSGLCMCLCARWEVLCVYFILWQGGGLIVLLNWRAAGRHVKKRKRLETRLFLAARSVRPLLFGSCWGRAPLVWNITVANTFTARVGERVIGLDFVLLRGGLRFGGWCRGGGGGVMKIANPRITSLL